MSLSTIKKARVTRLQRGLESLRPGSMTPSYGVHSVVYFIREDRDGGAVKIGVAGKLANRICDLQVGNPNPLEVLAWTAGCGVLENCLHQMLMTHYIRGEWFKPHEEVLSAARELHGRPSIDWTFLVPFFRGRGMDVKTLVGWLHSNGVPY